MKNECKWYRVCPMKYYYEMGRLEKHWILDYCKGDWSICVRYKMEEMGQFHQDWMLQKPAKRGGILLLFISIR